MCGNNPASFFRETKNVQFVSAFAREREWETTAPLVQSECKPTVDAALSAFVAETVGVGDQFRQYRRSIYAVA